MSPPKASSPDAAAPAAWWSSLPGILTALAGLVTAVAGLLTVLRAGPADPTPTPTPTPPPAAPVAQPPAAPAPPAASPVAPVPVGVARLPLASAPRPAALLEERAQPLTAIRLSVEVRDPDGHSNLREGPGTQTPVIGRVDSGQRVTLLGRSGSWWKVRTADGREGYLHGSRLPDAPGS